jgi:NAD(P)-dependent dehydrogenase (short-subunit alcohol dehydrogenase family)
MIEMPNRNVLITGASRGLGHAIAACFWDAGANVALVGRSRTSLEAACAALGPGRTGQQAWPIPADLGEAGAAEAVMAEAQRIWPKLDVLVNNAAIQGPIGPLWENDWTEWNRALVVNLLAPVALCRLAAPWMGRTGGGSIVNLSGGGATGPRARFSCYATAKAALVRFSETLAEEAAPLGVRVNCVAPGAMASEMTQAVLRAGPTAAGEREYAAAQRSQASGAATASPAGLVYFLATPAAEKITGRLVSAVWDQWASLPERVAELAGSDIYTLRRITPADRGKQWA